MKECNISRYGVKNLGIFYYHDSLIKIMKKTKFEPSIKLLQMYCQCNPGYNILNGANEIEQQYLLKQHERYLEGFYKFSMLNRVCEIVQNYIYKTIEKSSTSFDKKIDNPFLLKCTNFDNMKMRYPMMVLPEQEEIIGRFCAFFQKNVFMLDDQMGEQFDNLVGNMFLSFSVCVDSDINAHKFDNLVALPNEYYATLIKWIVEHIDDCTSNNLRDNGRFYHVLSTFMFIHHIDDLIGMPLEYGSRGKEAPIKIRESITAMLDPLLYFKNPKNRYENVGWFWGYNGQNTPFYDNFPAIYQSMSYYGNMTDCECICCKKGIFPGRTTQKYDNRKTVTFLTMQEIFYDVCSDSDRCEPVCH